jgi:hypothetical protein
VEPVRCVAGCVQGACLEAEFPRGVQDADGDLAAASVVLALEGGIGGEGEPVGYEAGGWGRNGGAVT